MNASKIIIILGSINAALAVMFGAFGAHALKTRVSETDLNIFHTGSQYHFYHALGLLVIGVILSSWSNTTLIRVSAWVMFAGIVLFSGSLYLLVLTQHRWLGAITPVGGTAFIIAWICLLAGVIKS